MAQDWRERTKNAKVCYSNMLLTRGSQAETATITKSGNSERFANHQRNGDNIRLARKFNKSTIRKPAKNTKGATKKLPQTKKQISKTKRGKKMERKQPPRAIETIASDTEDEMNEDEENTTIPNNNQQNMKEENTSDEEHNPTPQEPQESTIVIESTGQSEPPERALPPRRGNRNRNKADLFGHNVMITQVTQSPSSRAKTRNIKN